MDAPAELTPEFAFLREMLATSGPWARAALGAAACDSPWFVSQARELAPASPPNPALAIAAGITLALPLSGPLAAQARDLGTAVRQVLGHQDVDGEIFDFRDGEAVWSDSGKPVARTQLRAMDTADRQEFYASMGLAAPAEVLGDAPAPAIAQETPPERIKVARDGREAPVLAEIRERIAALRQEREAAYVAQATPPSAPAAALAPETVPGTEEPAAPTAYDAIWAEVAAERSAAKARGEAPRAALSQEPSAYQLIWAEVAAERAGTLTPPDLVDVPRTSDVAGIDDGADLADAPPDRDLVDASAAFLEPRT